MKYYVESANTLSLTVQELFGRARDLSGFQLFRLSLIIANSSKGLDCPWALQALRISFRDQEHVRLRDLLVDMRIKIDNIVVLLDKLVEEYCEEDI